MELELKYLFIIFGSLVVILVFSHFFGVPETPDESVITEDSQINTHVFGDLHQIEN